MEKYDIVNTTWQEDWANNDCCSNCKNTKAVLDDIRYDFFCEINQCDVNVENYCLGYVNKYNLKKETS